jgi:hypothetical protein
MAFLFRLELADGTPADPPKLDAAVPNWRTATRSTWAGDRYESLGFETKRPTHPRCWSLRTWPDEPRDRGVHRHRNL